MLKGMNANQRTLFGLIVGGAVGSVLAFLFAPKPGKELRTDIAEGFDRSVDKIKDSSGKIASSTKVFTNDILSRTQAAFSAGVDAYKSETNKTNVADKATSAGIGMSPASMSKGQGSGATASPHLGIPAEGPDTSTMTGVAGQVPETPHSGIPAEGPDEDDNQGPGANI